MKAGFRVEAQVTRKLRDAGWYVVNSGGSLGEFDRVAIKEPFVLGIQVKKGKQKWHSPLRRFGSFYPVLIRRLPGQWQVTIQ